MTAVCIMPVMHEYMHQRTCQQQQKRQHAEQVSTVLGKQKNATIAKNTPNTQLYLRKELGGLCSTGFIMLSLRIFHQATNTGRMPTTHNKRLIQAAPRQPAFIYFLAPQALQVGDHSQFFVFLQLIFETRHLASQRHSALVESVLQHC